MQVAKVPRTTIYNYFNNAQTKPSLMFTFYFLKWAILLTKNDYLLVVAIAKCHQEKQKHKNDRKHVQALRTGF